MTRQLWYDTERKRKLRNDGMNENEIITCDECGSEFLKAASKMLHLCPECSHILYGYPSCNHIFENGKCIYCYWNGKRSSYIKKMGH